MRSVYLVLSCLALAYAAAPKAEEDTWNEISSDVKWRKKSTAQPKVVTGWSGRDYKLLITLSKKVYSDTTAEIFVVLEGDDGKKSEWTSLGKDWGKSQMGKTTDKTIHVRDVGQPSKLHIKSRGSNAVLFENIYVQLTPDRDPIYFNTNSKSIKCARKSWFVASNQACIAVYSAADSGVDYVFVVTLENKRNSASSDKTAKVYAALKGAARGGEVPVTGYMHMEQAGYWTKDKMGKPVTLKLKLRDIGPPTALLLKSDSGDAITFKSITVAAPGMNAIYFNTDTKSVKCKSDAWFTANNANCINEYKVGAIPGKEGKVVCVKRTPATPIESSFTKPLSSQDLTYGTHRFNFTVRLDCAHRGAYRFEYHAQSDCGKLERRSGFSLDPDVDKDCQQKNGKAYPPYEPSGERSVKTVLDSKGKLQYPKTAIFFDRGHLVPANHMDSDVTAIYESNYMTNILPQAANMNRGAWLQSEELIECFREQEDLYVLGGAVYDTNYKRYNWFKQTHYVDNPSYFWKIIKAQTIYPETGHMLALWMPNSEDAVRAQLDSYVVSIAQLETNLAQFGQAQKFDVSAAVKKIKPTKAWVSPTGCDKQL